MLRPKKSTPAPATTSAVRDVPVDSIDKTVRMCQAALKKVIELPWLVFESVESNLPRKNIRRLTGTGAIRATDRHEYLVVRLLETRRAIYWLAASLDFYSPLGSHGPRLTNISLLVFEGSLATEQVKRPVLRAEWDCTMDYRKNEHAQPHWHVYSSLLDQETAYSKTSTFGESIPVRDFSVVEQANDVVDFGAAPDDSQASDQVHPTWPKGDKFHFAMAARWQSPSSGPHSHLQNEILDPNQLGNWIERCLAYIVHQLKYIDG